MRSAHTSLLLLLLTTSASYAQEDSARDWKSYDAYQRIQEGKDPDRKDTGSVSYHQAPLVDSLIARYQRTKKEFPGIPGFRIQLYFGERNKAEELRADFKEEFEEVPAYVDYYPPNFRLRVGDFRTRIEAYRFLQELGSSYGSPYIVETRIELPKLRIGEEE